METRTDMLFRIVVRVILKEAEQTDGQNHGNKHRYTFQNSSKGDFEKG